MQKVTFLIGIPCSGKSTYREKELKDAFPISRDDIQTSIINAFQRDGADFTYADFFARPSEFELSHPRLGDVEANGYVLVSQANELLDNIFKYRIKSARNHLRAGGDVVVDLLNLTKEERAPLINELQIEGKNIPFEAVVFKIGENLSKIEALNARRSSSGKFIPFAVIQGFANIMTPPCPETEAIFSKVLFVDGLK